MAETIINHNSKIINFEPWYGEFGWEIATWAPWCRRAAEGYDKVIITSFAGMEPLYADFITDFKSHEQTERGLNYSKRYRIDGKYYRYGDAPKAKYWFDILIHQRGISRKNSINYRNWNEFLLLTKLLPFNFACIGSQKDSRIGDLFDLRSLNLQELMNQIAAARLIVGVSSGLMHLAAFCGTDIVVWGDRRTYFGETLEKRYKQTWNPFGVRVGWIDSDDWQPEPEQIIEKIKELL